MALAVPLALAIPSVSQPTAVPQWNNPLPQGQGLHHVEVVGTATVYAVGEGGTVARSDDDGQVWRDVSIGLDATLLGAHFHDAETGVLVGELDLRSVILGTVDGGATWHRQGPDDLPWLESVEFWDADIGVAVGRYGCVLWTTDGGANWASREVATNQTLKSVRMLGPATAVAVGTNGVICRTADAGMHWSFPASGTTWRLEAVDFQGGTRGIAVGWNGTVLVTQDGGGTWTAGAAATNARLMDVAFRGADLAIAAGSDDGVMSTTDGGMTWTSVTGPGAESWSAVAVAADGGSWLTGDYGTLWRSDPGLATWTNRHSGSRDFLYGIAAATDALAVAVGEAGTILRTTDAGSSWTRIPSGTTEILRAVDFADAANGMLVGEGGVVLRTDDAGLSWSPCGPGTTNGLRDIACFDADHAVAVGENRTILLTTDGGATWSEVGGGSTDVCQGVHFSDASHGWIVTWYGEVLTSTDAGATWMTQASTFLDLQDVHFHGLLRGVAVGGIDYSATLVTDDGGANWAQQTNPDNASLYGVAFGDLDHCVAVGSGLFLSSDAAATWKSEYVWSVQFMEVCFVGPDVVLAVGGGGAIIRIDLDAVVPVRELPLIPSVSLRAFPNPFNPELALQLTLESGEDVRVAVFDLGGRLVRELAGGTYPPGRHEIAWHGRDGADRCAPSGVYVVRAETGHSGSSACKVSLVR
ncbi:MAG: hypothetical protein GY838_15490 [bacterium]|nr:hypothetical protein [bacterium]